MPSDSNTTPCHPDVYDGSMFDLDMRKVDRQWNQWTPAPLQVRHTNRRRVFRGRFLFVAGAFGRSGHITPAMTARLIAIDDAINGRTAIKREHVSIELDGSRKPMSFNEWMEKLEAEDEENAAAIRAQAEAGEGTQVVDEWELAAA